MRRYLAVLAVTTVASFALIWVFVAAAPLAFLDPEYPAWLAKRQMLERCDLGDIVIVGDSRAAVDIMPVMLPVKATNLAVGGGSPVEAYFVVTRMLSCLDPPHRVIVSLDAPHFIKPDLFWERTVRFGFLDSADLADIRRSSIRLGDLSIDGTRRGDGMPSWLRARLYAVRFPTLYFNSLIKGGVFLRWWHNRETLARTLDSRGQYFFGTDDGSSIVGADGHLPEFKPLPVLNHYFDRMLDALAARGIVVDFVAMPMNQATAQAVRPGVRDDFAAYLDAYAFRYGNFRIAGDVMPAWPDRWFGDGFGHLNPAGARRFSAAFSVWLTSTGVSSSTTARGATENAERRAVGMVE